MFCEHDLENNCIEFEKETNNNTSKLGSLMALNGFLIGYVNQKIIPADKDIPTTGFLS